MCPAAGQSLSRPWDRAGHDAGRQVVRGRLFHHGPQRQQPQPRLRGGAGRHPYPGGGPRQDGGPQPHHLPPGTADGPGTHRHQRGPDGHHPGVFKAGPSHGAGPPHAGIRAGRSQLDPADFRAAGAQRQLQAVHPESRRRDRQTLPAADLRVSRPAGDRPLPPHLRRRRRSPALLCRRAGAGGRGRGH